MKKDIVSGIKTVGLIAATVVATNSCKQKSLTESQIQDAQYKTDSAANLNPEYQTTVKALSIYEAKIQEYRTENKNMLKNYSKRYIQHCIKDATLRRFLVSSLDNPALMDVSDLDIDENACDMADIDIHSASKMRFVRRNHRWFNDLIMYLTDKYDERQLLNSNFFKTIQNMELKKKFEQNAKSLTQLHSVTSTATRRQGTIYNNLWEKYIREAQRTK